MSTVFCQDIYYGYIIKGDLIGAISYVKQFSEQTELYNQFMAIFEQEKYHTYEVDAYLNEILTIYQRYYRNVFYLSIDKENAADKLRAELAAFFSINDEIELCDIEQYQIAEAFENRGFIFSAVKQAAIMALIFGNQLRRKHLRWSYQMGFRHTQ